MITLRLLLFLTLLLRPVQVFARSLRAVVVDANDNLKGPVNDANNIVRTLQDLGFSIERLSDKPDKSTPGNARDENGNVIPIRSPSKKNILAAIRRMMNPKALKRGDTCVFYFAGHGKYKGVDVQKDFVVLGQNYVCVNNKEKIHAKELNPIFHRAPPGVKVLVLVDACHSGFIVNLKLEWSNDKTDWQDAQFQSDRRHSNARKFPLIMCLAACQDEQRAGEGGKKGKRQGFFTERFLKHFFGSGRNKSISQQFKLFSYSKTLGKRNQVPMLTANCKVDIKKFSLQNFLKDDFEQRKGKYYHIPNSNSKSSSGYPSLRSSSGKQSLSGRSADRCKSKKKGSTRNRSGSRSGRESTSRTDRDDLGDLSALEDIPPVAILGVVILFGLVAIVMYFVKSDTPRRDSRRENRTRREEPKSVHVPIPYREKYRRISARSRRRSSAA